MLEHSVPFSPAHLHNHWYDLNCVLSKSRDDGDEKVAMTILSL